jgi:hypothetical protein
MIVEYCLENNVGASLGEEWFRRAHSKSASLPTWRTLSRRLAEARDLVKGREGELNSTETPAGFNDGYVAARGVEVAPDSTVVDDG